MAENLPTTTDNLTFAFSLFNVSLLIMTRQPKSRGETRNGRSETLTAHSKSGSSPGDRVSDRS